MFKYALKNMIQFAKQETIIFLLMLSCALLSSVMVIFLFGFYHHIEQKRLDADFGEKYFGVDFYDYEWSLEKKQEMVKSAAVNKRDLLELLCNLPEDILGSDVVICFEAKYLEDVYDDHPIDNSGLCSGASFSISNHKPVIPFDAEKRRNSPYLKMGRYYTAEEYNNGEFVCIGNYWIYNGIPNNPEHFEEYYHVLNPWAAGYMPTKSGTCMIHGKEYRIIGNYDTFTEIPDIPVTTMADDAYIKRVVFYFEQPVTSRIYTGISSAIKEKYGNLAAVMPLNLREVNSERFYNTLLYLCIIVTVLSSVVTSFLYQYILLRRERNLEIFRFFGMTLKQISGVCFLECTVITIFMYISATFLFQQFLLPLLKQSFEYMPLSYNIRTYSILGILYVGISLFVLSIMVDGKLALFEKRFK